MVVVIMTINIKGINFCEEINSLEMMMLIFVPILTMIVLYSNGYNIGFNSTLLGILLAIILYVSITIVKNIVAKLMNAESVTKIPQFSK